MAGVGFTCILLKRFDIFKRLNLMLLDYIYYFIANFSILHFPTLLGAFFRALSDRGPGSVCGAPPGVPGAGKMPGAPGPLSRESETG